MFDVVEDRLLVADADTKSWARQRHVATTNFRDHTISVIHDVHRHAQASRLLVSFLDHAAGAGWAVELDEVFMRFSLNMSYAVVFTADLESLSVATADLG